MNALEQLYRGALRWYPESWREANAEPVIGTLMDAAEGDGREHPLPGELANLRVNGLRTRLAGIDELLPSVVRDRAAAMALGIGATISIVGLVSSPGAADQAGLFLTTQTTTFGPFASLSVILYAVWILALVAALFGLKRTTRVLLLATIPAAILARLGSESMGMAIYPTTSAMILVELFALLALVGRPGNTRGFRGLTVLAAATAAVLGFLAQLWHTALNWRMNPLEWEARVGLGDGLYPWGIVAIVIAAIVLGILRRRQWSAALALLSIPFLFATTVAGDRNWSNDRPLWSVVLIALAIPIIAFACGVRLKLRVHR